MPRNLITEDPYPEEPGDYEHKVRNFRAAVDSWDHLPPEFKEVVKQNASEFLESRIYEHKDLHGNPMNFYYGGQLGHSYWVIKNDEVDFLSKLSPGAMAIVTFFAVPTTPIAVTAF